MYSSCRGYGRSALRNWVFQVSKDGQNWTTLYTHVDDCSLNEPGYGICQKTDQLISCNEQLFQYNLHNFFQNSVCVCVCVCQVNSHMASGSVQRGEAGLETHQDQTDGEERQWSNSLPISIRTRAVRHHHRRL